MLADQSAFVLLSFAIDFFDNLRFNRGSGGPLLFELSRTTISLLDYAFRSQIGKCRSDASSEKKREQCGHYLRLS